jgi:hypothetical protein
MAAKPIIKFVAIATNFDNSFFRTADSGHPMDDHARLSQVLAYCELFVDNVV